MSRAGDSYISLTCHMLDQDFAHHFVLACRYMSDSHTGENLRYLLESMVSELDIPETPKCFAVTDSARNYVSPIGRTEWAHVTCFAHKLQLCVQDAAKRQSPDFSAVRAKARSLVGHYKRSCKETLRLNDMQRHLGMKLLGFVQDVPT